MLLNGAKSVARTMVSIKHYIVVSTMMEDLRDADAERDLQFQMRASFFIFFLYVVLLLPN